MARKRTQRRSGPAGRPGTSPGARAGAPRPARATARSGAQPAGSAPPPRSGLRARIERASTPALLRLTRLPRLLVPVIFGVLVVVGLAAPVPVAAVALGLVVVFVGWLTYLSWPAVSPGGRAFRIVTLALLVGYLGWLVAGRGR